MLTSQGDEEQIFVTDAGGANQALSVLQLSASVDDTAWPSDRWGTLYADSTGLDTVDAITGPFETGRPYVAVTPCDENSAPSTCPGPWLSGQLAREAEPLDRRDQTSPGQRRAGRAAGNAVPSVAALRPAVDAPSELGAARRGNEVAGAGFEPAKAEPTDLQSVPFDRSGIPPGGEV